MGKNQIVWLLCVGIALAAGCQNAPKQENIDAGSVVAGVAGAPSGNVEVASTQSAAQPATVEPANVAPKTAPSLGDLLMRADAVWALVRQGDNISAGRGAENVLAAAEALLAAGDTERATEYFRRLTVIAPLQVEFRFRYAGLCAAAAREGREGREREAAAAYQIVLKQAETDVMINTSAAFLGVEAYEKLPAFAQAAAAPSGRNARICLA